MLYEKNNSKKITLLEHESNSSVIGQDNLLILFQQAIALLNEYRENNDELFEENQELLQTFDTLKDSKNIS